MFLYWMRSLTSSSTTHIILPVWAFFSHFLSKSDAFSNQLFYILCCISASQILLAFVHQITSAEQIIIHIDSIRTRSAVAIRFGLPNVIQLPNYQSQIPSSFPSRTQHNNWRGWNWSDQRQLWCLHTCWSDNQERCNSLCWWLWNTQ